MYALALMAPVDGNKEANYLLCWLHIAVDKEFHILSISFS